MLISQKSLSVAFKIIGNIVGSGFFMVPNELSKIGLNMLYSWLLTGLMALIYANIFAQLFIMFPKANNLDGYFENYYAKMFISLSYWATCIIGNTGLLMIILKTLNIDSYLFAIIFLFTLTIINQFLDASFISNYLSKQVFIHFGVFWELKRLMLLLKEKKQNKAF